MPEMQKKWRDPSLHDYVENSFAWPSMWLQLAKKKLEEKTEGTG